MMGNVFFLCVDCGIELRSPNALSFINTALNLILNFFNSTVGDV